MVIHIEKMLNLGGLWGRYRFHTNIIPRTIEDPIKTKKGFGWGRNAAKHELLPEEG